jgi:hypothetical protein
MKQYMRPSGQEYMPPCELCKGTQFRLVRTVDRRAVVSIVCLRCVAMTMNYVNGMCITCGKLRVVTVAATFPFCPNCYQRSMAPEIKMLVMFVARWVILHPPMTGMANNQRR